MATPDELDPLLHRGSEFRPEECEWKHGGSCSTDAARRLSPKGRPLPERPVLDSNGLLMEARRAGRPVLLELAVKRRVLWLATLVGGAGSEQRVSTQSGMGGGGHRGASCTNRAQNPVMSFRLLVRPGWRIRRRPAGGRQVSEHCEHCENSDLDVQPSGRSQLVGSFRTALGPQLSLSVLSCTRTARAVHYRPERTRFRTRLTENIVFTELYRRQRRPFYYKTASGKEVDFACVEGRELRELIQVSHDISAPSTRARELDSLLEAISESGLETGLLLTQDRSEEITDQGRTVLVRPVTHWLLER